MSWIRSRITSGIGISLSVVGVGTGIATTAVAAIYGLPVAAIGVSVAAPIGCAYHFITAKGNLDATKQIKALNDTNGELQKTRLELDQEVFELDTEVGELRDERVALQETGIQLSTNVESLEEQLTRLSSETSTLTSTVQALEDQKVEMAAELLKFKADTRVLMQNLFVVGDKFDGFADSIAEHDNHLGNSLNRLDSTADRLDHTTQLLLERLNGTLDQHISQDVALANNREILFGHHLPIIVDGKKVSDASF